MNAAPRSVVKRWLLWSCVLAVSVAITLLGLVVREIYRWQSLHNACVARARQGNVELLFLGDSLVRGWSDAGVELWNERFAPRAAANFGIPGDSTRQVRWRVTEGRELEGIQPCICVLLVGTNDLEMGDRPPEVVREIRALIETLRAARPQMRIILMGLLPRDRPGAELRSAVAAVNAELAALDDGATIRFLDIGPRLVDPSGRLNEHMSPDELHMGKSGYRVWADALEPLLAAWDCQAAP